MTHLIYCRGCQMAWLDPSLADRDECACTCADPGDPLYEAWVTDPDAADLKSAATGTEGAA